jgi:hypothetical protein
VSAARLSSASKSPPLWLTAGLSFLGYLLLAVWFPLQPHFNVYPLADIRDFTPSLGEGLAYGLLLLALFGLYALAYQRVRHMAGAPRLAVLLLTAVLFCLPLLQTFPVNATDIYRYVIRGRVASVYGENPYESPPAAFPDDPFLPLAGEWAGETSPYGPVWELLAATVTSLTRGNLLAGLLAFKLVGLLTFIASGALIWFILPAAPPQRRLGYTLLWAWNPALLLTFIGDAHNDALMIFWLLLGLWLIRRYSVTLGFLVMLLAPLTKPIALLPLPLFFIAGWRNFAALKERLRFLLVTAVGGLILLFLAFLPFGSPLELAARLLREATNNPGFSLSTLILLLFVRLNLPPPIEQMALLGSLLFGGLALWLAWRSWHGRSPIRGAADIFAGYIAQALAFRLWYAAWPFPWLLLDRTDNGEDGRLSYRLKVGLWFLVTVQLSVLIYGHGRVFLLSGDHFLAHLIGVPFTFGLPFLLAKIK